MVKAAVKPRRKQVDLREDIAYTTGRKLTVDREKGIVYGVKVCGTESINGRRYLPEALRNAISLYEGIGVYANHPKQPNDPREVTDRFGWLENIQQQGDGSLYGDLHILLPKSELAEAVFNAAEQKPDLFGLSHNAKGEGKEVDGIFIVEQILSLRSVDLVTEPATTGGLVEQRNNMTIKIKQLFENAWKKYAKKTTKRPKLAGVVKRLLEDDDMMDKEIDGSVPEDHEEALKGGFRASVAHIVDACLDGSEDPKECVKRIKELLTAHDKLTGGDDEPEDDYEEEEEEPVDKKNEPEPEKKEKEAEEQRKRLRELEAKDNARELCEEMGVACDKVLLEALIALPDAKSRKRLLEREKTKGSAGKGAGPRSGADGGSGKQQQVTEGVNTPEGILAALMS